MPITADFLAALRSTLNHLHDADRLRRSPIARYVGVADRFDTPRALRAILIDAVETLKPAHASAHASEAWTTYEVLFYRYVQQLSQQEVADQFGISMRHLRRKQRAAIEALAWLLWQQYDLEAKLGQEADAAPRRWTDADYEIEDELRWLADAPPATLTDLNLALQTAIGRAQPLADATKSQLEIVLDDALPALLVHPVALKQIILNLISLAIRRSPGGTVVIRASEAKDQILVSVQGAGRCDDAPSAPRGDDAALELARRMADLCGGSVVKCDNGVAFAAELRLPMLQRVPVLALDDNQDFLQLLERYVADTRYRVVATRDPEAALRIAADLQPAAVLLDVMMPDVDGWEVLAKLRQHPATEHLPIIVCTILVEEDLALALGASAFLKKPVNQQQLVETLAAQIEPKERAPRSAT